MQYSYVFTFSNLSSNCIFAKKYAGSTYIYEASQFEKTSENDNF